MGQPPLGVADWGIGCCGNVLSGRADPAMTSQDQLENFRRRRIMASLLNVRVQSPDLWLQAGLKKNALVDLVAVKHGVPRSTLHRWLSRFRTGAFADLERKTRCNVGRPLVLLVLNGAAHDCILAAALPKPAAYGNFSISEIAQAYFEERAWRAANAGRPLNPSDAAEYRRYVDAAGKLRDDAMLPKASRQTIERHFHAIQEAVTLMTRGDPDAFAAGRPAGAAPETEGIGWPHVFWVRLMRRWDAI